MSGLEKKFATKSKIVNYIINRESTSKVEISKELNLSMPTVLSNVKDLLEKGIIIETGEYESTGGRKAKSIGINPSYRYAMGIVITANHLGMVLVNLKYEIVKSERIRLKFVSDMSYCSQVADYAAKFLDHMNDAEQKEKLLGVGISIPGIINPQCTSTHGTQIKNEGGRIRPPSQRAIYYSHSMASVLPSRHSSYTQFSASTRNACRRMTRCRVSSASGTKAGTTSKTFFKLRALSFCFCPKVRGGSPLDARWRRKRPF